MSTLEDAFKRGQQSYQDAARAKAEIQALFGELSKVVEDGTDGRVRITFGSLNRVKHFARTLATTVLGVQPEAEEYDALIASRVGGDFSQRIELCSVKIDPHGYPVEIRFPGYFNSASDRISLEKMLGHLISHPDTGGKIDQLRRIELVARTQPQITGEVEE